MDAIAMKDKERKTWTDVTPGWRKRDAELVAWARPVTERILERARVGNGQRVLDIACGTGEPAIPAARRVGSAGFVLGVDFVEDMLAFARDKAVREGLRNVEFRRQDGEELDAPAGSFDCVTMRFGLMFMPDPVSCLKRAWRALKPGGCIALATWAPPEKNPWVTTTLAVLKRHADMPAPPPGAPGLFAMADPERLRSVLSQAGFREVQVEETAVSRDFGDGKSYFQFLIELAGPLAAVYAALPGERQTRVAEEVAAEAEKRRQGGKLVIGGLAWVASAVK